MSAEAVAKSYEFGSGNNNMMLIDLNLSLHHYSPTNTTLSQPSQRQHQEPSYAVSLSPAADRKVVVDLTKSVPTSSAGGSQSQNSTLSTTRKRTQHHQHQDEIKETHLLVNLPVSTPSGGGGGSDEEELDGENSRKKLRLSRDQSLLLEDTFKHHNTLNPRQKQALAKQLGLSARQVEVWFQNRRARTKLKQTEAECEYMKRNCETLMDRVQRLQREVNELRSLKLAPQIYMQMPPATTLALCPSCERVIASSGGVRVDCSDAGRIGSVSGNLWASSNPMIQKPF